MRLLILDEPTGVLTPQETVDLFHTLRTLTSAGLSIVFITHKLNEVMVAADRVTVLRDGKVVGRRLIGETNPSEARSANGRARGKDVVRQGVAQARR